uniref:Uncharacterized protein n=1 Tax=Cyclopterus lumpus TaxID=8103 RepID=A0A8C3GAA6_CYCLU
SSTIRMEISYIFVIVNKSDDKPKTNNALGVCQKHFCCLTSVTSLRMCSHILCCLSQAVPPMKVTGAALSSTPVGHAATVLLFTFSEQLSGTLYDYGCPNHFRFSQVKCKGC